MTPGNKVMIYEDPITQLKPEGRGRLIRRVGQLPDQEYWRVRFMDGYECIRWIKVEEKKNDDIRHTI